MCDWMRYKDQNTKYLCAKVKQRNMHNYMYSISNVRGEKVEGFEKVAKVIAEF